MNYDEVYQEAENYYFHGDYQKGLELFKIALKINDSQDCLNYIGCCYLNLGDFYLAGETFNKLIAENPTWERPIMNMGRMHLELNNRKEALKCFEKAVTVNPENEDVYYYLGVFYFQISDYEKAKTYYENSLFLNNEQSETHLNLGLCYFRLSSYEKAIEEFDLAYSFDINCIDAIYNKGLVFYAMGKYSEALNLYLKVDSLASGDTEIMYDIAHCYFKLSDFDNSIVWAEKVLLIEPEDQNAMRLLKNVASLNRRNEN